MDWKLVPTVWPFTEMPAVCNYSKQAAKTIRDKTSSQAGSKLSLHRH